MKTEDLITNYIGSSDSDCDIIPNEERIRITLLNCNIDPTQTHINKEQVYHIIDQNYNARILDKNDIKLANLHEDTRIEIGNGFILKVLIANLINIKFSTVTSYDLDEFALKLSNELDAAIGKETENKFKDLINSNAFSNSDRIVLNFISYRAENKKLQELFTEISNDLKNNSLSAKSCIDKYIQATSIRECFKKHISNEQKMMLAKIYKVFIDISKDAEGKNSKSLKYTNNVNSIMLNGCIEIDLPHKVEVETFLNICNTAIIRANFKNNLLSGLNFAANKEINDQIQINFNNVNHKGIWPKGEILLFILELIIAKNQVIERIDQTTLNLALKNFFKNMYDYLVSLHINLEQPDQNIYVNKRFQIIGLTDNKETIELLNKAAANIGIVNITGNDVFALKLENDAKILTFAATNLNINSLWPKGELVDEFYKLHQEKTAKLELH